MFTDSNSSGSISYLMCELFYARIISGHASLVSHVERSERIVTGTAVLVLG